MPFRGPWLRRMYPDDVLRRLEAAERRRVWQYLTAATPAGSIRRSELNKYLKVRYTRNAVNRELIARLRSDRWDTFMQAVNELQSSYFFEKIGRCRIVEFEPRGVDNRRGDLLLRKGGRNIFVEVKAPLRVAPNEPWVGNEVDVRAIRANLERAYEQIPREGTRTMIVLAGELTLPVSIPLAGMEPALLGERVMVLPVGPQGFVDEPRVDWRRDNAFFQPNQHTEVSAVASLEDTITYPRLNAAAAYVLRGREGEPPRRDELPEIELRYTLRVYHNPYARTPIAARLFERFDQFAPLADDRTRFEYRAGTRGTIGRPIRRPRR